MTVSSITWGQTVQWGGSAGAAWGDATIDAAPPVFGTGTTLDTDLTLYGGAIFDANGDQSLRFATVGGVVRVLDPPILLEMSITAPLTQALLNAGTDNQIEIGVVPDASPANFSNSLIPWDREEQSLGIFTLTALPAIGVAPTLYTFTLSSAATTLVRALVTSRGDWNGKLALSFRSAGTHALQLYNLVGQEISAITSQESLFFGGLTGGGSGKLRAVRDGRYGMPAWNTELVRDGDQQGLFVRPWDSDPEDEQATYRRKPGEGTVTDDVPDL